MKIKAGQPQAGNDPTSRVIRTEHVARPGCLALAKDLRRLSKGVAEVEQKLGPAFKPGHRVSLRHLKSLANAVDRQLAQAGHCG